ncbi:hypothetical protein [Spiroplasma endosymbiont of Nebria brevicollis]|uniref:hypothetical protein n=1 Tax=Spiroplasma endosymbiont of Nebria brevicollis TaxID=3066284 RepID=UPI00313BFCA3
MNLVILSHQCLVLVIKSLLVVKQNYKKITSKTNQTTNYSASNDTIIITTDLLVDDILDEK